MKACCTEARPALHFQDDYLLWRFNKMLSFQRCWGRCFVCGITAIFDFISIVMLLVTADIADL
jgi:hypothetical protein